MKNIVYGVVWLFVVSFSIFGGNQSVFAQTDLYRPLNGIPNATVIGIVQTNFESLTDPRQKAVINQAAYIALLEAAKKEHSGSIDIADIAWVWKSNTFTKGKYTASGKVILLGGSGVSAARGVEGALERAVNDVSKDFNNNARIAIVQISAPDRSTRDYIIGELEYILQQQGYYMVDRAQLDKIFDEQRFGATSDVDDNTAARMGKISGASIVITGRIDGEGNLRRLRLRALNTETARVVGVASERL